MQKNFDSIYIQLDELEKNSKVLLQSLKNIEIDIYNNQDKIKKLIEVFPCCCSCGHHKDPKQMIIADKEDVDTYYDQNEGYCGPEIGKYYCGC